MSEWEREDKTAGCKIGVRQGRHTERQAFLSFTLSISSFSDYYWSMVLLCCHPFFLKSAQATFQRVSVLRKFLLFGNSCNRSDSWCPFLSPSFPPSLLSYNEVIQESRRETRRSILLVQKYIWLTLIIMLSPPLTFITYQVSKYRNVKVGRDRRRNWDSFTCFSPSSLTERTIAQNPGNRWRCCNLSLWECNYCILHLCRSFVFNSIFGQVLSLEGNKRKLFYTCE